MLNTIQNVLLITMLMVSGALYAEDHMQKARVNLKEISIKRCNVDIAQSKDLEGLNKEQFCQCSTDRFVDELTDVEMKQLFLKQDYTLLKQKQNDAATYCMANNASLAQMFDRIFYKGCMNGDSKSNPQFNKEEYCACTAKKLSSNLSQQDMQDFIKIGKEPGALVDTAVSDKMMSYATECLSQMVSHQ